MADGGWDLGETVFIGTNGERQAGADDINRQEVEDGFYSFIMSFRDSDESFLYRELLKSQYFGAQYFLQVDLAHLNQWNSYLAERLRNAPNEYLPVFEAAAKRAADQITAPRPDDAPVRDIQIMLSSDQNPLLLRQLHSDVVAKLIRIPGIVIKAGTVKIKATRLRIRCRNCNNTKDLALKPGISGASLPRTCDREPVGDEQKCPLDPYEIVGDKSEYVNQQMLRLQESPDLVPTGELPRHVPVSCDRYLTRRIAPGSRVTVIGVYDIYQGRQSGGPAKEAAVRLPYIRAVGLIQEADGDGRQLHVFTADDEKKFAKMAEDPELYEKISASICPEIFGSADIKKAAACMLFGGSRKQLPDGMRLRGDVNVLLLGDPGTAKSQLLKRVEKLAPVAVYTSGKGSSAAGLTASVVREASSRDFYLEAGAMVLADGGVVCIDEFDKMREEDRVAIHEAMEQQTISIAKAGITTVLNSRCSVFAAANSTFGKWDDNQDANTNIDMQATILSRFDMIFIVKDVFSEEQDKGISQHVIKFHQTSKSIQAASSVAAPYEEDILRKYINYARRTCGPRLNQDAAERLINEFVTIRASAKRNKSAIPITVRQLEAIVRISESLAKMRLQKFATASNVDEALRLFRVSTLQAAMSGDINNEGPGNEEYFTTEDVRRVEEKIQRRFPIGNQVSVKNIVDDLTKEYSEFAVQKALHIMVRRGDFEYRHQRKVLFRRR